jgi:hypothetical protein
VLESAAQVYAAPFGRPPILGNIAVVGGKATHDGEATYTQQDDRYPNNPVRCSLACA